MRRKRRELIQACDTLLDEGLALFRQRRWKAAWEKYEQAADLAPDSPIPELLKGFHCFERERFRDSLRHFHGALCVTPELAVAHCCIGNVYYEMGDFDEADRAYKLALEMDSNNSQIQSWYKRWLSKRYDRWRPELDRRSPRWHAFRRAMSVRPDLRCSSRLY